MMKKIICLVLGLLMVLMAFTACGNEEDAKDAINDKASRTTTTLNMWVITESELVAEMSDKLLNGWDPDQRLTKWTDEQRSEYESWSNEKKEALEQLDDIGDAISKITKKKLKTKLNVVYVTADRYYEKLEQAFVDHEKALEEAKEAAKAEREALKNGETLAEETEPIDETEINDMGIPELKYPEAPTYQVDVFFVGNFEKYREYADADMMVSLDDKLENTAMQLSYYVNQVFLDAAVYNGVRFAIPNHRPVGEYTYLCVKTAEMEKYGFNVSDFSNHSVYDGKFYEFIAEVQKNQDATGIYPIYTNSADGKLPLELIHYWNYDLNSAEGDCLLTPDQFSLFGSVFNNVNDEGALITQGTVLNSGNMLSNEVFMKQYLARKLEYEASYITTDATVDAAACVVTGGWELQQQYVDNGYQVLMMANPRAVGENVYDAMFAVGGHTTDENRAMEIITLLNTNSEMRNLLQYGIEGVNYTLSSVTVEENGTNTEYYYVEQTANNFYKMDIEKTGNVFIAYPEGKENVFEWEYGKHQNLDAALYPTIGFHMDLENYKLDTKSIRIIEAVSDRVWSYLQTLDTAEKVVEFYDTKVGRNISDDSMAALLLEITDNNMTYVDDEGKTAAFTQEELVAALQCMKVRAVDESKEAIQSPYALYINWITMSGF